MFLFHRQRIQTNYNMILLQADPATTEAAEKAVEKITHLDFSDIAFQDLIGYAIAFGKNILTAILVFVIGRFIIKYILKGITKLMRKRSVEASLQSFTTSATYITLNLILAIIIISILGIDTTTFVGLLAGAGMAIGMALSGTLQNFAGGVMLLLFKPYKVGHFIEAQGYAGTVKEIQIFNTILTTVDNQTIIIPNGGLSTGTLKNYSNQPNRRVDINVEVAYGTKPADVRNVLKKITDADERIHKIGELAPTSPMTEMSASSIVFQLRVWTASENYWGVMGDTTEAIYNELTAAGIEIPFQQIDVHMR